MSLPLYTPATAVDVRQIVAEAAVDGRSLRICGGGSKRLIQRHHPSTAALDMNAVSGITDYDPDELVLTVRAGTRLTEIETALAERQQMLAFEPFDHGPLFGEAPGRATLGGIVAANVSGPRRLSAGAARDHILGFTAVSGRGEVFKGGGAVVKNVTGFDLPKLMAGSWGTLAVLTSITMRVLPRPRTEKTLLFRELSEERANRLMIAAVSSPAAVSCAAHFGEDPAVTALRIEGFGPSVEVRCRDLMHGLREFCAAEVLEAEASAALWRRVRTVAPLPYAGHVLWRVSVPPASGWQVRAKLGVGGAQYLYDWGGALVWVALPEDAPVAGTETGVGARNLGEVARELGGYAQLLRAPPAMHAASARASPPAMRAAFAVPAASAVAAAPAGDATLVTAGRNGALRQLHARVKAAFDPLGVLNPGVDLAGEW
jgi:glycolate oxidase FAD binding subunit